MKLSKQKIKNILIIVLSVFVLVPLIYLFFDMNPIQEGMVEWSWEGQSTKMDRVDVSGIEYKTGSTGVSNEYLYCIGGNVVCPSGSELTGDVSYTNFAGTEQLGTTYNFKCVDPTTKDFAISDLSHVRCEGNLLSTQDGADFYFRAESADSYGNYAQKIIAGAADLSNESIAGFTTAFNYIPLEISGTYVYLYNSDASLDFIATPCYLYSLDGDTCASTYYTEVSSNATTTTTTTSSTDTTSSTCSSTDIPCLANNGAVVGDPLCCGQSGVLQNTKYNCPASAPYCEGYKCGSSWGKCVSTQS